MNNIWLLYNIISNFFEKYTNIGIGNIISIYNLLIIILSNSAWVIKWVNINCLSALEMSRTNWELLIKKLYGKMTYW